MRIFCLGLDKNAKVCYTLDMIQRAPKQGPYSFGLRADQRHNLKGPCSWISLHGVFYFMASEEGMTDCIKWPGYIHPEGYGRRSFRGETMNAHRAAWIEKYGEVTKGTYIDHLCRNRACINLEHLRAITNRENVLCGTGVTAINSRKRKCINGHDFSPKNTYERPGGGRSCRMCHRVWNAAYEARKIKMIQENKTMTSIACACCKKLLLVSSNGWGPKVCQACSKKNGGK